MKRKGREKKRGRLARKKASMHTGSQGEKPSALHLEGMELRKMKGKCRPKRSLIHGRGGGGGFQAQPI